MKEIGLRIIIGILSLNVVFSIFYVTVKSFDKEKQYQYLTIENEWGFSSNCYLDENQNAVCFEGYELIKVRQFYEV